MATVANRNKKEMRKNKVKKLEQLSIEHNTVCSFSFVTMGMTPVDLRLLVGSVLHLELRGMAYVIGRAVCLLSAPFFHFVFFFFFFNFIFVIIIIIFSSFSTYFHTSACLFFSFIRSSVPCASTTHCHIKQKTVNSKGRVLREVDYLSCFFYQFSSSHFFCLLF